MVLKVGCSFLYVKVIQLWGIKAAQTAASLPEVCRMQEGKGEGEIPGQVPSL